MIPEEAREASPVRQHQGHAPQAYTLCKSTWLSHSFSVLKQKRFLKYIVCLELEEKELKFQDLIREQCEASARSRGKLCTSLGSQGPAGLPDVGSVQKMLA